MRFVQKPKVRHELCTSDSREPTTSGRSLSVSNARRDALRKIVARGARVGYGRFVLKSKWDGVAGLLFLVTGVVQRERIYHSNQQPETTNPFIAGR
jgi:hypothetical protein